jgi:pantoate--beta-alanine ligase
MSLRLIESLEKWRSLRGTLQGDVGFVPTMGALHEGHLELGRACRSENQHAVFSIFVNPTQFNDPEDLKKYPRTLESDLEKLERIGVDYVLSPSFDALYPDKYRYAVDENELSRVLCGAHRPGHFRGMLTIVMKLLNIVRARRAYFGEKDFQQLELVRGMVESFFMDVEIVPMPIVREKDGLAMSSRNQRLTPEQRKIAPVLHQLLDSVRSLDEIKRELKVSGFEPEYVEERLGRRLVAAKLGDVRLIDNVASRCEVVHGA